jgi:hypothetical protein
MKSSHRLSADRPRKGPIDVAGGIRSGKHHDSSEALERWEWEGGAPARHRRAPTTANVNPHQKKIRPASAWHRTFIARPEEFVASRSSMLKMTAPKELRL